MGPDFFDRQSLWFMFCCNFIENETGYQARYRISEKAGYPVQPYLPTFHTFRVRDAMELYQIARFLELENLAQEKCQQMSVDKVILGSASFRIF